MSLRPAIRQQGFELAVKSPNEWVDASIHMLPEMTEEHDPAPREGSAPSEEGSSPPPSEEGSSPQPSDASEVSIQLSERGGETINVVGFTPVEAVDAPPVGGLPAPTPPEAVEASLPAEPTAPAPASSDAGTTTSE